MLKNTQRIILLLLVTFTNAMFAQQIKHTNQQWIQFYHQHALNNKYTLNYDGGLRKIENNTIAVALVRIGVGYKLTPFLNGATGIASFNNLSNYSITRLEIRPYQEISFRKLNLFSIDISNRFRVEYRHFTNFKDGHKSFTQNNFRFRYRLGLTKEIFRFSTTNAISLTLANELFINTGKQIIYNTFDNNRIISGISFKIKNISYSIIYTYQYGNRATLNTAEQSNIIWFTINLQTTKKHV